MSPGKRNHLRHLGGSTCGAFNAAIMAVTVLSREHGGEMFRAAGLTEGDDLELAAIGVSILVAEFYAGIDFGNGPAS